MLRDRSVLYLGLGETLVWGGVFYIFPPLLVHWENDFGWSRAEVTGAFTLAIVLSAVTSPRAGKRIDAGLGPHMLAGCTAIGGVLLGLLSLVEQIWQFYAVWALLGMAMAGALYDPCFALVTRARGAEAKRPIIHITLMAGFASTLAFPAAYAIVEEWDWRMVARVFAAVVVFVAAPLLWAGARRMEREGKHGGANPPPAPTERPAIYGSPLFWLLGIAFAFGAVIHGGTLQHLFPILHDRGVDADTAVLAASCIGPMQVAGRVIMMMAERRVSNHAVAAGCFVLMGLAMALLYVSTAAALLVAGFVIMFGGAYGTVSIIRPVITREVMGEAHFGAKFGAMSMLYLAGSATAPYMVSLVWGVGGYDLVLPGMMALAGVGLVLYLAARRLS